MHHVPVAPALSVRAVRRAEFGMSGEQEVVESKCGENAEQRFPGGKISALVKVILLDTPAE